MSTANKSWVEHQEELLSLAHTIDPAVRLHTKDNWFSNALATIVMLVTFGGMSREDFLKNFATTIGPLQFYPRAWRIAQVERILVHESRHTKQSRWFSFGIHPWVGLPFYAITYLLLFFPLELAFFRAWFERDALKFELKWHYRRGAIGRTEVCTRATNFGNTVCSGKYGWSLPKKWGVPWFEKVPDEIFKEATQ